MNLHKLGVPVYRGDDGKDFVIARDLKLSLSEAKYAAVAIRANVKSLDDTISAEWLENTF